MASGGGTTESNDYRGTVKFDSHMGRKHMRCNSSTPIINDDGVVQTCLDFEDGTSLFFPYFREHFTLVGKDIQSSQDLYPTLPAHDQSCPFCNTVLHLTALGNYCYNIYCPSVRLAVLQKQLRVLETFLHPDQLNLVTIKTIENPLYDLVSFVKDTSQTSPLYAATKNLSLQNYLRILRIPEHYDESVESLAMYYGSLHNLVVSVLNGQFVNTILPTVTVDFKNAILLTIKYINQNFARNLYTLTTE